MSMPALIGRVWTFGDNINTDLMLPSHVHDASVAEQARAVFSANRPGWVDLVREGDMIVGGRNYGTGSSRPAARALRHLGVRCLLADSINGLFYRNCVNFGLPALECPGISACFTEGEIAEVNLEMPRVTNRGTGHVLTPRSVPPALLEMMLGGGLYPLLERQGLIVPSS
ncbi:MAG TPA: 3-isopropylmalate dehydratase [Beijerinckiaceae bacterium]|jgi:3-isopropylmalate/(R)-2-methylmalate dehydratase small subunit|nr:3-isopropylmalate dehydratase [Beijerinckiaceae bacterium]